MTRWFDSPLMSFLFGTDVVNLRPFGETQFDILTYQWINGDYWLLVIYLVNFYISQLVCSCRNRVLLNIERRLRTPLPQKQPFQIPI